MFPQQCQLSFETDSYFTRPSSSLAHYTPIINCLVDAPVISRSRESPRISLLRLSICFLGAFPLHVHAGSMVAMYTRRSQPTSPGWSKEDLFALIGIPLAILSIITMVIIASPTVRRCLCMPCRSKLGSSHRYFHIVANLTSKSVFYACGVLRGRRYTGHTRSG